MSSIDQPLGVASGGRTWSVLARDDSATVKAARVTNTSTSRRTSGGRPGCGLPAAFALPPHLPATADRAVQINQAQGDLPLRNRQLVLLLGKRIGWPREQMRPHNLTLTMLGAGMLWLGWYGFNVGSIVFGTTFDEDPDAFLAQFYSETGRTFANTTLATFAAILGWLLIERQGEIVKHRARQYVLEGRTVRNAPLAEEHRVRRLRADWIGVGRFGSSIRFICGALLGRILAILAVALATIANRFTSERVRVTSSFPFVSGARTRPQGRRSNPDRVLTTVRQPRSMP